jgi:hypothetical protein
MGCQPPPDNEKNGNNHARNVTCSIALRNPKQLGIQIFNIGPKANDRSSAKVPSIYQRPSPEAEACCRTDRIRSLQWEIWEF